MSDHPVVLNENSGSIRLNNKTNNVSVLDVASFEEVDRYDTEIHPDGIASLRR